MSSRRIVHSVLDTLTSCDRDASTCLPCIAPCSLAMPMESPEKRGVVVVVVLISRFSRRFYHSKLSLDIQIPLSIKKYCVVISSVYFYAVIYIVASNLPSAYSVIPYYRICTWPVIVILIFLIPQQLRYSTD